MVLCKSHFTADSQSECLGFEPSLWTFDQILLPFSRVLVWNLLSCLCGAPSLTRGQSHFTADSQSITMSWFRAHFVDVRPDIASFWRVLVWNLLSVSVGRPLWRESESHFTADGQSVRMSWYRAQFVHIWPDIASFWRVWVWNLLSVSVGRPLWRESESHFTADSQWIRMSWFRAHFVHVWPDIASFSRVLVWNLLSCVSGAPSLTRGQSHFTADSQSVKMSWFRAQFVDIRPDIASFFRSLSLEFVVLSLWGALSDERSESLYGWQSVSRNL
jgi:hypothetical protein